MKKSYKNIEAICDNIATLYEDGISVSEAIKLLDEIDLNKNYKKSLADIEQSVLKGNSLHEAFNLYPELYPDLFRGFLSIGETNGRLTKVLKSLGKYYSKRCIVRNKLIASISYPIFLMVLLIILSLLAIIFFIPLICNILNSMDSKIPVTIQIVCNIRNNFINHPIVSSSYLICYCLMIPGMFVHLLIKKIDINKYCLKFKFFRLYYESILILMFSIISESEINLSNGISNCIKSYDQKILKEEFIKINNSLLEGRELSETLANCSFISKSTISMILIGEKGGSVNNMLVKLEKRLNQEFINYIDKMLKTIQPAMIIFLSVIVSVFIVAFVLPLFNAMYSI